MTYGDVVTAAPLWWIVLKVCDWLQRRLRVSLAPSIGDGFRGSCISCSGTKWQIQRMKWQMAPGKCTWRLHALNRHSKHQKPLFLCCSVVYSSCPPAQFCHRQGSAFSRGVSAHFLNIKQLLIRNTNLGTSFRPRDAICSLHCSQSPGGWCFLTHFLRYFGGWPQYTVNTACHQWLF